MLCHVTEGAVHKGEDIVQCGVSEFCVWLLQYRVCVCWNESGVLSQCAWAADVATNQEWGNGREGRLEGQFGVR